MSARQLEEMIAERIGIGPLFVRVHPDPALGWHARLVAAPGQEICSPQSVEDTAAELRSRFDLQETKPRPIRL
jgi:hypothetical protein